MILSHWEGSWNFQVKTSTSAQYAPGSYIDDVTYIHGDDYKRSANVQTETTRLTLLLREKKEENVK